MERAMQDLTREKVRTEGSLTEELHRQRDVFANMQLTLQKVAVEVDAFRGGGVAWQQQQQEQQLQQQQLQQQQQQMLHGGAAAAAMSPGGRPMTGY